MRAAVQGTTPGTWLGEIKCKVRVRSLVERCFVFNEVDDGSVVVTKAVIRLRARNKSLLQSLPVGDGIACWDSTGSGTSLYEPPVTAVTGASLCTVGLRVVSSPRFVHNPGYNFAGNPGYMAMQVVSAC